MAGRAGRRPVAARGRVETAARCVVARRPRRAHGPRTRHPVNPRAPEHRPALRCWSHGGRPAVPRSRVRRRPADRQVLCGGSAGRAGPRAAVLSRWRRPLPTRMEGWSFTAISSLRTFSSPAIVEIRLLDFGIAKLLDDERDRQSGLTELAGRPHTPEYASPEQISGEPLSTGSDIYSLGVVLYELVAGSRPTRSAGAPAAPSRPQSSRSIRPRRARRRRHRRSARSSAATSTRLSSRLSGRSRPTATRRSTRLATTCTAGSRDARCSHVPTARDTGCRSSSGGTRWRSPWQPSSWRALRRSLSCRRGRRACSPNNGGWRKSNGTRPSRWSAC